jgi:hypothetical protein
MAMTPTRSGRHCKPPPTLTSVRARRSLASAFAPHADSELVQKATAAADGYLDAIKSARQALIDRSMGPHQSPESMMAITKLPDQVEHGIRDSRLRGRRPRGS